MALDNHFTPPARLLARRRALTSIVGAAMGLALRSLVTGIPPAVWLHPARAYATAQKDAAATSPKFVIYSTSGAGDPINCNAPGTYDDPLAAHAQDPSMAATAIVQNGVSRQGAQVWSGVPAAMLDNMAFFHHSTYTLIHTELSNVMRLQGAVNHNNMLPCALAHSLSSKLGTITSQAMCLYDDLNGALIDDGIPLPMHPPASLRNVIGVPQGVLGSAAMMQLRDNSLDALNAWAKSRGKSFQTSFIDQYALSQTQARTVQQKLGATLNNIKDNSVASQINLAIALFQLNLTPVAAISIPFGGDNHYDGVDAGQFLTREVPQHKTGVASLATLYDSIKAAGLGDKVSFLLTNVFGRNLSQSGGAKNGRGHNDSHAVSLLYGPNIRGGVVGGIAIPKGGNDFKALPIVAQSGLGAANGDVAFADTLATMGKTFTASVGGETDGVSFRSGTVMTSLFS